MILCPWKEIDRYEAVIPGLQEAVEFINNLKSFEPAEYPLPRGKVKIQRGTTHPLEGAKCEAHRKYLDIQLVLISALLTGLNLYNKLARFGGAGTLVPITGFANSVVSPAIDFKSEGFITGMAAKVFVVAGPVIVFGTAASAVYGLICWLAAIV